jgi:hypothetical protein
LNSAEESVTFPRMNYRRKKISMKEQLEEAIEEIGGEPPQGALAEREAPEERLRETGLAAPGLRQPHGQAHRRNPVFGPG